jgi:hypothetical protein
MQENSQQNKFDINLDPKQTERLKEIFGLNKKHQFCDFMVDSSNKKGFYNKLKKKIKRNKSK